MTASSGRKQTPSNGAVASVQGELGPGAAGGAGGVQGAFGVLGAEGTLPFTGFPLWAVVLLGLASLAFGLTFRHHARPRRAISSS